MSFIWPAMLFLLLLIPLSAVLYVRLQRHRREIAKGLGSLGVGPGAAGPGPGARRHLPPALFLAGLTILVIALARPQTVVQLPRVEGTVILSFDVSGSMAAEDLTPTRMEAAKAAARDFVGRQPSTVQIGVVAFSDSGFSVQPPTNDTEKILAAINRLEPQRGTSLGQGIYASLDAIAIDAGQVPQPASEAQAQGGGDRALPPGSAIILLTDGENNESPDPLEAAHAAADNGVRIYTVGIGSAAGISLDINGFTVYTQLNEALLQDIAQITSGAYSAAENEEELRAVYTNLVPQLVIKPEKMEVTSLLAGASLLFLLVGGTFSLLWFGRVP